MAQRVVGSVPCKLQRFAVVFSVAFALVACSSNGADRAAPTRLGGSQSEPVRGGTLVVGDGEDPGHLNPAITTAGHTTSEMLYNGLVRRDEHGDPQPELAESWTVEEQGALYRFRLRQGLRWHDGVAFTAADVKFTFEELLLKFHARTKASIAGVLAGIDIPDPQTVVFRFKQPYAPLLYQLDTTEAPILAQHIYAGTDPQTSPANLRPIGTGPFKFESYTKGAEIRLSRNQDYFKPGLPYLDGVVVRIIPDPGTRLLALEKGEIDFVWGVPASDTARLGANPRLELFQGAQHPGGSNGIVMFGFNLDRPVLADLRVRQAVAHAVDSKQILDQVQFGEGRVPTAPISSGISWAHAQGLDMPRFDRAESQRLLDAAGWHREGDRRVARGVAGVADGTTLTLDVVLWTSFTPYGEVLRQQLREVGIDLVPKPLEPPVFPAKVFVSRDFDTFVVPYSNGPDPEIGVRRLYDSSQIGPVPYTNGAGYRNAEVDRLFNQASQSVAPADRSALYRRIQEILVRDLPYDWLTELETTRAWVKACAGFAPWTGLFAESAHCAR